MIPRNELTFDGDFKTHKSAAVVIVNFKLVLQELDSYISNSDTRQDEDDYQDVQVVYFIISNVCIR
jgi:hypothetical protein